MVTPVRPFFEITLTAATSRLRRRSLHLIVAAGAGLARRGAACGGRRQLRHGARLSLQATGLPPDANANV
jgi:hypothetical protein